MHLFPTRQEAPSAWVGLVVEQADLSTRLISALSMAQDMHCAQQRLRSSVVQANTTGAPSTEAPISNKNMDPKLVSQLHIKSYAISTKTWLPSLELCKGVTNSQDDGPCPF